MTPSRVSPRSGCGCFFVAGWLAIMAVLYGLGHSLAGAVIFGILSLVAARHYYRKRS